MADCFKWCKALFYCRWEREKSWSAYAHRVLFRLKGVFFFEVQVKSNKRLQKEVRKISFSRILYATFVTLNVWKQVWKTDSCLEIIYIFLWQVQWIVMTIKLNQFKVWKCFFSTHWLGLGLVLEILVRFKIRWFYKIPDKFVKSLAGCLDNTLTKYEKYKL